MLEKKKKHEEEKAILVGLITKDQTEPQVKEYLEELAFLAETAGATAVKRFAQRLPHPDSRTFIGKGKLEEIKRYIDGKDIQTGPYRFLMRTTEDAHAPHTFQSSSRSGVEPWPCLRWGRCMPFDSALTLGRGCFTNFPRQKRSHSGASHGLHPARSVELVFKSEYFPP